MLRKIASKDANRVQIGSKNFSTLCLFKQSEQVFVNMLFIQEVSQFVKSIENKEITTISLTTDTNIQTQASDYVIFAVPENEFNNIISKLETNNKYIIPELNLGFDNKQLVSCFVSQHAVA